MPSTQQTAQPRASPHTSNLSLSAKSSIQARGRMTASSAASNPSSNSLFLDSDDDLSDAPESPVYPNFPKSRNLAPHAPPPDPDSDLSDPPAPDSDSDSDSDLSDAPESPVWPEGPKAPLPRCMEKDCPVRQAIRHHHQGPYLHSGEPPRTTETIFGSSNPPPHVWESWMKIQARDCGSTVEDDWNILGFLRWHVDNPNTSLMGI